MATYTLPLAGGLNKKVQGGTPDRINVPAGRGPKIVRVTCPWDQTWVYARGDSTTAVADADGTYPVFSGTPVDITVQPGDYISVCAPAGYGSTSYAFYSVMIVGI